MAVYSNGVFSSGIDVLFENGESAVNAAVLNGGTMRIGQEGTAESVVLVSGGRLVVSWAVRQKMYRRQSGGLLTFLFTGDDFSL